MTNPNRKTLLAAFVLFGTIIIILSIAQGFKGFNSSHGRDQAFDTAYTIRPFKLPENVTFAGEKMPQQF